MKKTILFAALLIPTLSFADLSIDQGKSLTNNLASEISTCNKSKIDDFEGRKSCERAQEIEARLFSGGWCYSSEKNSYRPCDPGYSDFLNDVFKKKKTLHREVVWGYATAPTHISQVVPSSYFLYRYYPERKCKLPLANANDMRYMERTLPDGSVLSGCFWRVLGNEVSSVYMYHGQPQYDKFPDYSISVTKLGKNGTHVMVIDRLMTLEQMRKEITEN
ncbi:hypothetical protein [Burkholderia cenocepacia]|uniref:hypothetical protein n=1 Tax=Burkholderia cenocepacia TaxID=95486 RepID=UPI00264C1E07|nr:hypothetical protein [Burkholderia cenocepacia]MDN7549070.1 hypothetical protein [Burkholderia cenocepacia]